MTVLTGADYRRQVEEMMRGYRPAQVLIACAELGVFEALGDRALGAGELTGRLGADAGALARLLNAAVALGLLEKRGEAYANSPMSLACLAAEGPFYLGNLVKREGAFYQRWSRLEEAVRTGQRPEENLRDERQANWVRDFELALYDVARTAAPAIAQALGPFFVGQTSEVSETSEVWPVRVLDVGGGHGAYSIALAHRYPTVEAVVFDLPPVAEVAQEFVDASPVAGRVTVRAGDFKTDALGADFDFVLLFGVLVSEPPADAVALLRKIHGALRPGGRVVIRGFYLEPGRAGPLDATLFDLQMLLSTGAGGAHTVDELATWLRQAGFEPPETVTLPAPERGSLLVARK